MLKRVAKWIRAVAAAVLVAACGTSEPEIVEVTARLVSPHGDEGAAVIDFDTGSADPIQSVNADGATLFVSQTGSVTRVVIVSQEAGALAVRLQMNGDDDDPSATIREVAGPDDAIRVAVSEYRVEFVR